MNAHCVHPLFDIHSHAFPTTRCFLILLLQVLIEMSHTNEDIVEDRVEVRAEGALDAGSEARQSAESLGNPNTNENLGIYMIILSDSLDYGP